MRPIEKQINDRLKEIADLAYRINILYDDYAGATDVAISYAVDQHGFTIEIRQLCDIDTKYIEFDNLKQANEDFIALKRKLEDLFDLEKMLMESKSNWYKILDKMIERRANEKEI